VAPPETNGPPIATPPVAVNEPPPSTSWSNCGGRGAPEDAGDTGRAAAVRVPARDLHRRRRRHQGSRSHHAVAQTGRSGTPAHAADLSSPRAPRQTHIFLCVLAYHMLVAIEKRFLDHGVHTSWATLREQLATHHVVTVVCRPRTGRPCGSARVRHPSRSTTRYTAPANPARDHAAGEDVGPA
jgi:hypothetical protein